MSVDKSMLLKAVLHELEDDLHRQLAAQQTAAQGATHVEARAETKWDTCGLEQSYLARGHAKQFEALAGQVQELRMFAPADFRGKAVDVGALVVVDSDGERLDFFLLKCGGGLVASMDGCEITVITPESPVGAALMGKKKGDSYSFRAGMSGWIRHVS